MELPGFCQINGRTKKEKLTRSKPRRPGRNPFLSLHPPGPPPRRQGGSGRERAARLAGGCARLCLARREAAAGHPFPSASSFGSRETRARARLRERGHMAGPLRKGQSPRPGAPAPRGPAPRGRTQLPSLGGGAEQQGSGTQPPALGAYGVARRRSSAL